MPPTPGRSATTGMACSLRCAGRPDAGEHQKLRCVDGTRRHDDLAPRLDLDPLAPAPYRDPRRAPAREQDALGQRVGPDREVRSGSRAVEMRPGGAPAQALVDRAVHASETFLPVAVDVLGHGVARLPAGLDEGRVERVRQGTIARMERAVAAAIGVAALLARLGTPEIGQHVGISPAPRPRRIPRLEVHRVAADVDHPVDRGRAAEAPPARAGDAAIVEMGLGLGQILPVGAAHVHRPVERAGHAQEEMPVAAAGLEQQDGRGAVLG